MSEDKRNATKRPKEIDTLTEAERRMLLGTNVWNSLAALRDGSAEEFPEPESTF